jgi:hypothetical protein
LRPKTKDAPLQSRINSEAPWELRQRDKIRSSTLLFHERSLWCYVIFRRSPEWAEECRKQRAGGMRKKYGYDDAEWPSGLRSRKRRQKKCGSGA